MLGTSPAYSGELDERKLIKLQAEQAYSNNDFDSLNRQFNLYTDYRNQRTSSGSFKMGIFLDGISEAHEKLDESGLRESIRLTQTWTTVNKNSLFARLLHADALMAYGQHFRGGGYANTVSPKAWKIFNEYSIRARDVVIKSKSLAGENAEWQAGMLLYSRFGGTSEQSVEQLFDSGVKENPYNGRLYLNTILYHLPIWHGSREAVDRFIQYAAKTSPADYGEELYARLYSAAEQWQFEGTLYSASLVDWERMKAGLELWVERFPTSWNRNIFAYHACLAGDKEKLRQLLPQILLQIEPQIWNKRATYIKCVNLI